MKNWTPNRYHRSGETRWSFRVDKSFLLKHETVFVTTTDSLQDSFTNTAKRICPLVKTQHTPKQWFWKIYEVRTDQITGSFLGKSYTTPTSLCHLKDDVKGDQPIKDSNEPGDDTGCKPFSVLRSGTGATLITQSFRLRWDIEVEFA